MMRWVVTGPTGAGKSVLTELLAERGAAIVDGDRLGHEILRDPAVIRNIEREFGSEVLSSGAVDRSVLGRLVFADGEALHRLNRIMHGPLSELACRKLNELAERDDRTLAVLEAAVYFLLPSPPPVDLVITVTAPEDLRIERLTTQSLTAEEAEDRIVRQAAMEPAFATADVVIENTGSLEDLAHKVEALLAEHGPRPVG